jgi:hypothetical protein
MASLQMRKYTLILSLTLFFLFCAKPAQAYLDPGSGSMFLQIILGSIAGLAVLGKIYWHNLLLFFRIRRPGSDNQDSSKDSSSSS